MPDTGWKNPTATGLYYNDYTNPANAYASDDVYATHVVGDNDFHGQSYSSFDFGIPAGATIDGIEAAWEGKISSGTLAAYIRVWNNTSGNYSASSTSDYTTVDTVFVKGAANDLWSRTWTSADFSNDVFRVSYVTTQTSVERTVSLDHIKVKVYYTIVDYTMTASVGTFTLTGINVGLTKALKMTVTTGSYILTGIAALLRKKGWDNQTKNTTNWTNQTKNSANYTNKTKNIATYTNKTKNTAAWTEDTKNTATWSNLTKN